VSTFLELCKDVRREAGISGTGPSAVTGQTGEMARVVEWVNAAWVSIQNSQRYWRWMRSTASATTTTGDNSYTYSDFSITSFGFFHPQTFSIYTTSVGQGDESILSYMPWDLWYQTYNFGGGASIQNRPAHVSIDPSNNVRLGPKPDSTGYTIRCEYQKAATEMSADADEPEMPARFHSAIVWWALRHYALYQSAPEVLERAGRELRTVMAALKADQLPDIYFAGPLA